MRGDSEEAVTVVVTEEYPEHDGRITCRVSLRLGNTDALFFLKTLY